MQLCFREFIEKEEFQEDWKSLARSLPLMAAPLFAGSGTPHVQEPTPVTQQYNQQDSQKVVDALNSHFKTNISASQVQWIKPIDIISPEYRSQWGSVLQKAKQAQATEKIGDVELPALNSAAVTNVNKLEIPIPVIFQDPTVFGDEFKSARGFCTELNNQKLCVVKSPAYLSTLRHELSHATQSDIFNKSLTKDGRLPAMPKDFDDYFMNEMELGVRLAEMKRNYYKFTGKIVAGNKESVREMISHFIHNKGMYSDDVQQLEYIMRNLNKEEFDKLIDFIIGNIDKLVQKDSPDENLA